MYDFRPVTTRAADLAESLQLFTLVWKQHGKYTAEYLAWLYRDNPDGGVLGFNAWAGTELAAQYVTVPIAVKWNGVATRALLSLDTVTHPDHRRKQLFSRLAEQTYEAGALAVHADPQPDNEPGWVMTDLIRAMLPARPTPSTGDV